MKRQGYTLIFAVDDTDVARAVVLENWIEQDDDLVISELPDGLQTIVVRGQHRLVNGQPVQIILPDTTLPTSQTSAPATPDP